VYRATGDLKSTEQALKNVIQLDPAQFDAYGMLGTLYASENRLDEARAQFDHLAELRPKSAAGAQTVAGVILEMQDKRAEAQKRYEKALDADPKSAVAANNLAWIYAESGGNLDLALQLAKTAKAQLPAQADVNDTLGWVYYKKGMASLAIPPLLQSVQRDPRNAVYQYHLGLAYVQSGDRTAARKALEQALQINPKFDGAEEAKKTLAGLQG
jgi:tetratricopeptide (TPR) repeat protein